MAYSLIDYFRAFHTYGKEHELSACARGLYYTLLGEFNARRWPKELCFSDGELATLSGVQRRETIRDTKNLLKELKWINFRAGKNRKSVYELVTDNVSCSNTDNLEPSCSYTDNLPVNLNQVAHIRTTCEPSCTNTDNLPDNLPDNLSDNLSDNSGGFPMKRTRVDCRQEDNRQSSLNRASVCEDVDELIDCWEAAGGAKLNMLILAKFKALLRTHDLSSLKSAIERAGLANNGNYGFSYNFFLSKLNAKENVKEGDTSGDDDVEEHDPRDVWEFSNW